MDFKEIKRLVELMSEHDLTEIEIEQEDASVRLKRGSSRAVPVIAHAPIAPSPVQPSPLPVAPEPAPAQAAAPKPTPDANWDVIKSPMVGTFYRSSSPDAAAFVKVGDKVNPDTTVCIIEAMKVMNEIKAEKVGIVREICIENAETVEFAQVLFKIERG